MDESFYIFNLKETDFDALNNNINWNLKFFYCVPNSVMLCSFDIRIRFAGFAEAGNYKQIILLFIIRAFLN